GGERTEPALRSTRGAQGSHAALPSLLAAKSRPLLSRRDPEPRPPPAASPRRPLPRRSLPARRGVLPPQIHCAPRGSRRSERRPGLRAESPPPAAILRVPPRATPSGTGRRGGCPRLARRGGATTRSLLTLPRAIPRSQTPEPPPPAPRPHPPDAVAHGPTPPHHQP